MTAALRLERISKRFGRVQALDQVDLVAERGEVLAIVGENGAGKSTLMNVVYGLYQPDTGNISVFGSKAPIRSPHQAIERGIGMVHQHFMLVPTLTVAENIVLGREPRRFGLLDRRAIHDSVSEVASRFSFDIAPDARVDQIGVGMQQRVEILKALYRGAEILILDEPTANLTPQEADELLGVARGLARAGKTILFISHKLREVLGVADRVLVMRKGRCVWSGLASSTSEGALAETMVGRQVDGMARQARSTLPDPRPILQVRSLSAQNDLGIPCLHELSFELFPGEILAIAGVDGNGQAELAELLTGLRQPSSGRIILRDHERAPDTPRRFRDAGVGHVPADRQARGLCLSMRMDENLILGRQDQPPFSRGPLLVAASREEAAGRLALEFDIQPPDPSLQARAFSGGNQQKIILARELDIGPSVLVVVQPTRGLDVGAISNIHDRLRAERDRGKAILLFSLDLDEVLSLADRVLVLFDGRLAGLVEADRTDERALGRLMMGQISDPPRPS